jgi:dienelactone hydrolase
MITRLELHFPEEPGRTAMMNVALPRSTFAGAIVWPILLSAYVLQPQPASAETFVRTQALPIPTVTLTPKQFLTGDKDGKPAVVAGVLRIPGPPAVTDKLPAVILVPGVGGPNQSHDRWAEELNAVGVAVFTLDPYAGRGAFTLASQGQLGARTMIFDAYRALALLAENPRIDPARIAVMGFSLGSGAGLYSSNERFKNLYGPSTTQFVAHIALYAVCNVTYHDDTKTTGKPIRLFHGAADDWVPIAPCRSYVERLKKAGADVTLREFADAYHAYDNSYFSPPAKLSEAQTLRNCALEEGANGDVINSKTGKPFDGNDPCIEKGVQIAYNAAGYQGTLEAVKDFLRTTLSIKK